MTRLFSTFRWDVVIQFRNGFYLVSGFIILLAVGLLSQLPRDRSIQFELLIPAVLLLNLIMTTYYYVGGLVLLEKVEGTLMGLVVTPLRDSEYLLSKVTSLTGLALLESLLLIVLIYGFDFEPVPLVAGIVLLGCFYTLIGFVAIARYDSINEYLLPSSVFVALLSLPIVDHFGFWQSWIFYLHPVQPMLILIRAAFASVPAWEFMYGVLASLLWVAASFIWARRMFHRFVVRSAGD